MTFIALAAAAAAYTAPIPLLSDGWISPLFDFPKRGVRKDEVTFILAEITVTPHGGVGDCQGRAVRGNPNMAPFTCKLLRQRATFAPARDPSGRRMYGLYRLAVGWIDSSKVPPSQADVPADFQLTVERLPAAIEGQPTTKIQFAVDANGTASACSPIRKTPNQALAAIACQRLPGSTRMTPARDRKGQPVPSVQSASVKFVVGGGGR